MIPDQRHKFDIPEGVAYLNCGYMGPQLKAVTEAGIAGLSRKREPWAISADVFFSESEVLRGLCARVVGAEVGDIAIIPSVSYGIAVAAANVRIEAGQQILLIAEQFPSNVYHWSVLAASRGAEVVTVDRPQDLDWTSAILEAVGRQTAVVSIPQCHWTDGTAIDLVAVGMRCRDVGASLVIDGTQSVGTRQFSVDEVQPDFLVGVCYKWLLGPYSMGYLYVSPKHQSGNPIEYNWINRRGSEDFAGLTEYVDGFQDGARRFDVGERSNFALVPMAIAGLRQILEWGLPQLQETIGVLTSEVERLALEAGYNPIPSNKRLDHMIGVYLPESSPPDLVSRLAERGVYVSKRGQAIRVSPHVYNTSNDIERLFEALRVEIARAMK